MEGRRYIIVHQLPNAVGKLPEDFFLLRCDFFFFFFALTICMLLGSLFGKRQAFQINPWLREYQGFRARVDLAFLE